jgi:hypothetical protein
LSSGHSKSIIKCKSSRTCASRARQDIILAYESRPVKTLWSVYTAFVNAESGAVTLIDGTEPIYAFLTQEEFEQQQEDDTDPTTDTVEVTVAVTDASGEIVGTRSITVPQGGNVSVNIDNNRQNNTSQT